MIFQLSLGTLVLMPINTVCSISLFNTQYGLLCNVVAMCTSVGLSFQCTCWCIHTAYYNMVYHGLHNYTLYIVHTRVYIYMYIDEVRWW